MMDNDIVRIDNNNNNKDLVIQEDISYYGKYLRRA